MVALVVTHRQHYSPDIIVIVPLVSNMTDSFTVLLLCQDSYFGPISHLCRGHCSYDAVIILFPLLAPADFLFIITVVVWARLVLFFLLLVIIMGLVANLLTFCCSNLFRIFSASCIVLILDVIQWL